MRFARDLMICLIAGVLAVGSATGSGAADRFLSVIEDLPLMAQLREVPDSAVVYSKPQGRIVEVAAHGKVAKDAVLAFYGDTLPQLGWRRASDDVWQRGDERLSLGFRNDSDGLTVQFSLAPR